MDKVYVVYYKGEIWRGCGRKSAYLDISNARRVITSDSKYIVNRRVGGAFWRLSCNEQDARIASEKENFEIRTFTESN